jgi:hypothetical protein
MGEMLIEKVRQRTILYDTKTPDYRDQHMRANAWDEIGKDLNSRDVRIFCPRLYWHIGYMCVFMHVLLYLIV